MDDNSPAGGMTFDIEQIKGMIPHRAPFLLIDQVTQVISGTSALGIKNLSGDEPFFEGHFPDHPIMPGVLILEAMAQSGGVLILNAVKNPEKKIVYFLGIDKARFRKPVLPGDQLIFELTMNSFRHNTCKMSGKAFVNGVEVCGAEFMAMVVDK